MGTSPAKFIQEVKQEAQRVTWPKRRDALAATGVVLVMSILAAMFFLFVDWVLSSIMRFILGV